MNGNISEIESKIRNITSLATNSALAALENKIPDLSSLVKKTDYNTKTSEIEKKVIDHDHDKYITTSEFNKLRKENFKARLTQVNLVTKTDFDAKLKSLNRKINSNKTKRLLVENELKKLQKFEQSYLRGKNYIGDDGIQNDLVFHPVNNYYKKIGNTEQISSSKCKGLFDKVIKTPTASNNSLAPELS